MADDPDLTGRIRLDLTGLVAGLRTAQAVTRRGVSQLVDDANRRLASVDTRSLTAGLGRVAGTIGSLSRLAAPFAAAGAAIGSLLPLIAGLATALAQMAPAAALAVTGLLAIGLASATLKIAMSGVGDAVTAALDPSKPEAYAEALKKLSPNARSFVEEIRRAQPVLDKIQKTVQDQVFEGLDKQLRATAKVTLPELRTALNSTATTLNQMAKGAFTAARSLAKDGTLGTALKGATGGLAEFRRAPGQVVTALGQIGAAAAPAFQRLSAAGGSALDRLSAKITTAFESGAMEQAIEQAIDLFAQLGRVAGNIGGILRNVFGGLTSSGQGLFSTLETITASLREATASAGFQRALAALSQTMGVVASTVGPLLAQALGVLGPVIEALAGPAQTLVTVLGDALSRTMTALGPVLESAAAAFGELVIALSPLITVAGDLLVAILPSLTPLFETLGRIIASLAPVIEQVALNTSSLLVPILERLPEILAIILPPFAELAEKVFPLLADILAELQPGLEELATAFGDLLVELAPVGTILSGLAIKFAEEVLPALGPVLVTAVNILSKALSFLARMVSGTVVPMLESFSLLLKGDVQGAISKFIGAGNNARDLVSKAFYTLMNVVTHVLNTISNKLQNKAVEMRNQFVQRMFELRTQAIQRIAQLPGDIRNALGNAGSILYSAGASIVQGLVDGIQSKIGAVQSKLSALTAMIPDWKGPKRKDAKLLTPAGKSIIQGLIDGIDASTAALKSKLTSITNVIERAISINAGNRKKTAGLGALLDRVEKDNRRLVGLAKSRDKFAASLKAAQKRLADAMAERSKAAAGIRDGILGEGNITTGNNLVNSVSAITVGLQQAVAKAKAFGANLAALKKAGLRSDLLADIAEAGVDGGAATAAALAKATPEELARINELQGQLTSAATKTGASVAGAMYDSGVRAAQGLVDGLKKQQGAIEKQMAKIAAAMVKAIKKALKINSPSRVFMGLGEMTGAGLREGMLRSRQAVAGASASMAQAAVSAADVASRAMAGVPGPGQLTAAYARPVGGSDTYNINMYGTQATPGELVRELSWRGLVRRSG